MLTVMQFINDYRVVIFPIVLMAEVIVLGRLLRGLWVSARRDLR